MSKKLVLRVLRVYYGTLRNGTPCILFLFKKSVMNYKIARLFYLKIWFILISISIPGSHYDITTMYKFKEIKKHINQKGKDGTYLNTCNVSVHTHTNAVGFPFGSIKDPTKWFLRRSYHTMSNLHAPFKETNWTSLPADGASTDLHEKLLLRKNCKLYKELYYNDFFKEYNEESDMMIVF